MSFSAPGFDHVIPGNFVGSEFTDLFFYNSRSGRAALYTSDGHGRLALRRGYTHDAGSTQVLRGRFGADTANDLLFYNAGSGQATFYTSNRTENFRRLRSSSWGTGWTHIVRGRFGPVDSFNDLVLYNAATGLGRFYTTDGHGNITLLREHPEWQRHWSHIIPGNFGGSRDFTDLFFYRRDDNTSGTGAIFATNVAGTIRPLGPRNFGVFAGWSIIVPGNFGGNVLTDLFFYDAIIGQSEFYIWDTQGNLNLLHAYNYGTNWTHIVPGNFGATRAFTDLFFYDAASGKAEIWTTDGRGNVAILEPPPTVRLRVRPETIDPGEAVYLTWTSEGAGSLDLQPGIGPVPERGTQGALPQQSTEYTLTARNRGGETQATAHVTVRIPPGTQESTAQVNLQRQAPAGGGPVAYVGQFSLVGHTGSLKAITNPGRLQQINIHFPKAGSSTLDCDDPTAVIVLSPDRSTTSDQLGQIFGSPTPILPLTFIACAAGAGDASAISIVITYVVNG